MKKNNQVKLAVAAAVLMNAVPAFAQSSVTLYGLVDEGISYLSSSASKGKTSGGHSQVSMVSGVWMGSRFGLKGSEDLGGGTKAIFTLENGFNATNGALKTSNTLFSRQAFVGMANDSYGTLTAGRQYTSYYQLLAPFSPTTWLTGWSGAHPGDIDGLDTTFRANNTLKYTSPTLYGFTVSGSYSLGGVAGSTNAGSSISAGVQYAQGPIGFATGFQRGNNSNSSGNVWGANSTMQDGLDSNNNGAQQGLSAVNNGYAQNKAQQRFAVIGAYKFSQGFDITASYSNVQYLPGILSAGLFRNEAIFNTGGIVMHWKATPVLDLALGYAYTAATKANTITDAARYNQISASQFYSLSKRTGLYSVEGYTRASGKTLGSGGTSVINATATVGDGQNSTPSSSRSQVAVAVGMIAKF
ncbi:porin [Paraburkholderia sp. HP33-1]|uniref:porin n=1 Tax=Paraburkholderia sp. HP33-1 TaxID=2883243 RepID=UPI001F16D11B|nr:porin [Paraburkholderia sp. HP33-1]